MPAEEYWHGEPSLAVGYREAWRLRNDGLRTSEWLEGQYVLSALLVALDGALNGGKAGYEYPKEPVGMSAEWGEQKRKADEEAFFEGMRLRIEAANQNVE